MTSKYHNERLKKVAADNLDYLFRFAYFRLGVREDAEDAVHESFLRYFDKMDSIKYENARMYLFRILYNICNSWQSSKYRDITLSEIGDIADSGYDSKEIEEEYVRIESMLGKLPVNQREVIRMHTVDSLTFVEISKILEIPVTTLKSRYQTGMKLLRTLVNK